MTHANNTPHLARAAAARHDAADQRARNAIEQLDRSGTAITFTSVARTAAVSRGWLYQQPELRDAIINLRNDRPRADTTPTPATQRATTESLRQRLDAARDEIAHLRTDNTILRERLAPSLGQQRAHALTAVSTTCPRHTTAGQPPRTVNALEITALLR